MQPSPSLGWRDDVLARMRDTMARAQPGDFAVFDFDNTCIYHDIGDLYFQAMVNTLAFRTDLDAFWALFDPEDQPDALRALITPLRELSPEDRLADPRFEAYRRHMFSRYPARAARVDYPSGCALVVRLMVGLDPAEVQAHAAQVYQDALQQPLSRERWQDPLGGPSWSEPNHGTRVCVEIRDIMHELRERGVAVWVVSASATLWVQPYAALFGVPPERVLANGLTLGPDGLMTDALTTPFTYRQGKLDIIRHVIDAERAPLMAFGDAMTDFEMLCAAQLPVVIDRGIAPLREQAQARGWPLQPRDALTFAQR